LSFQIQPDVMVPDWRPHAARKTIGSPADAGRADMNLLWVENHPAFARYAGTFLAGYAVTVVPSLAAAREALGRSEYGVVLVDFDLDDGKGVDLVRELFGSARRPVVVAVSAHADGNEALLAAGADAACGKLEFARISDVLSSLTGTR
jgi:CheY-like chemotaxis protein